MTPSRPPPPPDDASGGGWSDPGDLGPAGAGAASPPPGSDGERYVLGAMVGRGAMGTVHAARDLRLGRDVALKELAVERAADPLARARLAREAAVTSRLDHPGIVPVYDVGTLPDGRPFYTMRLVRGRTLAEVAAGGSGEDRRRLVRHLLAAAEAVAVAHDAGIVHRDLKPANVLVGEHGETQVADWGLAAATPAAQARWRDLPAPEPRGRVGTERYMSPEQARGEAPDPRDDVWALGVTLAELIGERPPPELAAVVSRATAPDPRARYPDAAALAADLLDWFEGRRVAAYAYTPGDLLRRAVAAYRLPLAVGAAGLLAVAAAVAVGWSQTSASLARALAAEAAAGARLADLQLRQAVTATEAGDREAAERLALAVLERGEDPLARGVLAAFGRAERPQRVAEGPGPTCAWSALPPGAAWVACGRTGTVSRWEAGREVWTVPLATEGGAVQGDRVVVWDQDGTTFALDADDGAARGRWPRPVGDWMVVRAPRAVWAGEAPLDGSRAPPSGCALRILAAAWADGQVAAMCPDGTLTIGPAAGPMRHLPTAAVEDHVASAVTLVDGSRVLIGTIRGRVLLVSAATGATVAAQDTRLGAIRALVPAPDGRHAAVDGERGVGLVRLDTGTLVATFDAASPRAVGFSDEGLVVHDGALRTWRVPRGAPSVVRAPTGLADLAAAPAGDRLALAGGGGTALVVDLADGAIRALPFGTEVVKVAAWGPAGAFFSGLDGLVAARVDDAGLTPLARGRPLRRAAVLPDGAVVGIDLERGLYRWAAPDRPPSVTEPRRTFIDLERDGETVVLVDRDGRIERLRGTALDALAVVPGARAAAVRGERLVVGTADGVVVRDDAGTRTLDVEGAVVLDVAIAPDGDRVAAGLLDGRVMVWAADGRRLAVLPGHTERAVAVEFLADGDLASASWDKTARVWRLRDLGRPVAELAAEVRAAWGPG